MLARVDYTLDQSNSLFGRYVSDTAKVFDAFAGSNIPLWGADQKTNNQYFTGEYRGTDIAFPADLPWEPPTCNDLSYATGRGTLAAQPAAAAPAANAPEPAAKPWWMFWK